MTEIVRTLTVPASARTFAVRADVRDDYAVGPAVLVCVDVRGVGASAVRKFAPVAYVGGEMRVDASATFEDVWGEVEPTR